MGEEGEEGGGQRRKGEDLGGKGKRKRDSLMVQRAIKVSAVILMFQVRKQEPIAFK